MRYRRSNTKGATYFFTVNLTERSKQLLVTHINALSAAVANVKHRHPFKIDAWVVLPDHLRAIWTLPSSDAEFSKRWLLVKAGFSRCIERKEIIRASRMHKGERGIWQRRFWEHQIRDEQDLARHIDYIHFNLVKHGHVTRAAEWPYSSIHRYIRSGDIGADWGITSALNVPSGERTD